MTLFDIGFDGGTSLDPQPDFYPAYIGQHGWVCNGHDMWQWTSSRLGSAEWVECKVCGWSDHPGDEAGTIAAWHDHAMPGWRELPIYDKGTSATPKQFAKHISTYPDEWQFVGVPVITLRERLGTRSYMAREFKGFDISHTLLGGES